jgi:hypothetical protein
MGANVARKKIEPQINAKASVPNRPSELTFGIVLARPSILATHAPKLHAYLGADAAAGPFAFICG